MSGDSDEKLLMVGRTLRIIAADVKAAGDMGLVRLSPDGVTEAEITLSDELWLLALLADGRIDPLPDPDAPRPRPEQAS